MTVSIEPATAPGLHELLMLSDEFALSLYPADSCYLLDVDELLAPGVTVAVARSGPRAVGMGAIVEAGDGAAELKRMFVHPDARGRGLAGSILSTLENYARMREVSLVRLETGPRQPEAIALYEKHGYAHIPNFGPYVGDQFSVCMEKLL